MSIEHVQKNLSCVLLLATPWLVESANARRPRLGSSGRM